MCRVFSVCAVCLAWFSELCDRYVCDFSWLSFKLQSTRAVMATIKIPLPPSTAWILALWGREACSLLNQWIIFKLCLASLLSLDSCVEIFISWCVLGWGDLAIPYIVIILSYFTVKSLLNVLMQQKTPVTNLKITWNVKAQNKIEVSHYAIASRRTCSCSQ